jgi:hypothetical protein
MKTRLLTQAEKAHNTNRLHDAFIAALIPPLHVESTDTESRFAFSDEVTDAAIQEVINSYSLVSPASPVDIRAKWLEYKANVNSATTVPQLKAAITNDLGALLKELFKSQVGDLQ